MNRWVRIGIVLAAAGLGASQYMRYRAKSNETHQLVFKVEGPTTCLAQITTQIGETPAATEVTVPWESDPAEARGHTPARIEVHFPVGCGAPQQVSCAIERDGAAWKRAEGRRISSTQAEARDVVCSLDVDPTEGLSRFEGRDRIEAESLDFHRRARQSFLDLAAADPDHYLVLDGRDDRDLIADRILERVTPLLSQATAVAP